MRRKPNLEAASNYNLHCIKLILKWKCFSIKLMKHKISSTTINFNEFQA